MKASEHRDLTLDELKQRYEDTRKELLNLRLQQSSGQIEKATRIRDLRRDLARMLTIMREKSQKAQ